MRAERSPPPASELAYDLYLRTNRRFVFRLADHGVRLFGDRLGWTVDGARREAPLADIIDIHLTRGGGIVSGGDAALPLMRLLVQQRSVYVSVCRIGFRDGSSLDVLDGDASGLSDPARSGPYSEFVVRLHERLARMRHASITFAAGFSLFRFRVLLVLTGVLGLMDLAALVALFIGGGVKHVFLVAGATIWFWFQWRMVWSNAPRRYDPAAVPATFLPTEVERALPPPRSAAAMDDGAAGALAIAWPTLSRRWLWALPVPALIAIGGIVWLAATGESADMFEPGRAQQAFAAIEREADETLHIRRLDVVPRALTVAVEASRSHADAQGLLSHMETWTVTHATLFSGWRDWDSVSGPHRADSMPVLEEAASKAFALRPRDLPDLSELGRIALEQAGIEGATVRQMTLVHHVAFYPVAGEDPLRWTVRVGSLRESSELTFDHNGRYAGADRRETLRARNLDLLGGGQDFDDIVSGIRAKIGDGPVLAFARITPKEILIRTDDKQYEANLDGVADKTPPGFLCHVTSDMTTGRFSLGSVDWSLLAALQERAREAAPIPGARITAIALSAPEPGPAGQAPAPQWAVEARSGDRLVRVVFDRTGALLGVRAWSDQNNCD